MYSIARVGTSSLVTEPAIHRYRGTPVLWHYDDCGVGSTVSGPRG